MDSFIRFLYYSNEFDTAGHHLHELDVPLRGQRRDVRPSAGPAPEWVDHYLDLYAQIRPNLVKHADGYPTADQLRSLYKIGNITNVGEMDPGHRGLGVDQEGHPRRRHAPALHPGVGWQQHDRARAEVDPGAVPGHPRVAGDRREDQPQGRRSTTSSTRTPRSTATSSPNWPGIKIIDNQRQFWSLRVPVDAAVTPLPSQAVAEGAVDGAEPARRHTAR